MMALTPIPPQVDPRGRYNMQEAAEKLGVDRSTLRRWRDKGYIHACMRHTPPVGVYITGKEILRFWQM